MTKVELEEFLKKPFSKAQLLRLIADRQASATDLLSLSLSADPHVCFRAAWVLDHLVRLVPDALNSLVPQFLSTYTQVSSQGSRRIFSRVLSVLDHGRVTSSPGFAESLECTFEWLIAPDCAVAVQANCLDVLYRYRNSADWISFELAAQIEFLLSNASPALLSRGKRILKKLSADFTDS